MITFHKIEIFLKPSDKKPLPFIGSTIRGAFGVSLKDVTCLNPTYNCEGCFAKDGCVYHNFFEEKNRAHQYRFDIELNPKDYSFCLYLFEDATKEISSIVSAIDKMLTDTGLGVKREKFDINLILCNDKVIYKDGKFDLKDIKPQSFIIDELPKSIKLKLKTPLRMKYQNRLLNQKPQLETLLYSIQNRLTQIKNEPQVKLTFLPKYKEKSSSVKFVDQTRRSNRQRTKLQIGGVVGEIEYSEIDENSVILLKLGEILGVGKQTVFGMGKIEVKSL